MGVANPYWLWRAYDYGYIALNAYVLLILEDFNLK